MNPNDLEFLKTRVALLADFSDAHRAEIADGSRLVVFGPGEIIFHAGDEVHFLGVVMEGRSEASVSSAAGGRQALGNLGPGETFGEMALMSGDPALVDLTAEIQTRLLLVPLTLFQSHIMAEP